MSVDAQKRSDLVSDLLEQIGRAVGEHAHVTAVFGDPVERAGVTVIPVARARFGFGGGGGSGDREGQQGSGGGGGGGGLVSPVGYIEVRDEGAVFKRITTSTDVLGFVAAGAIVALAVKRLLD